jgi:hypothetical protein
MSFLSPLFLIGAVAAAVPILLHLLKREPELRVRFAAVRLLARAPVERTQHRRIRELLLLALRVVALVLIALAFARPFLAASDEESAAVTVVALDTSLSMSAPGQFERARELARNAIAAAPSAHLVGLVTFTETAHVESTPSADRAVATAALDRVAAGFGGTRYRSAVASAVELLNGYGKGRGTIVIVTDLQESGWDADDRPAIPSEARLEVLDVGAPPANLAITGVRRTAGHLVALLRNTGTTTREVRVQLVVDKRLAGEATASIGPNQSAEAALPTAQGIAAEVSIGDKEGIQADNRRFVLLDTSRHAALVLTATDDLEREAFYVRQALLPTTASDSTAAALAKVVSEGLDGMAIGQLSAAKTPSLGGYGAVVVLSTRGLDRRGRDLIGVYVRQGGGLLLPIGDGVDPEIVADLIGSGKSSIVVAPVGAAAPPARRLAPVDPRHPVFQAFGVRAAALGLVRFDRIAVIEDGMCPILARFTSGEPALVECSVGKGRVLVMASDLERGWNDFPLHASFVPFLHESVRYLSGSRVAAAHYLIGEPAVAEVREPGIVTLPSSRLAAVNVDAAESEGRRITVGEFEKTVIRLKDDAQLEAGRIRPEEDRQRLWRYLLVAVLAALVAEAFVGRRAA